MNNEKVIRLQLVKLLSGKDAHMPFSEAILDFPMDRINEKFPSGEYTSWHLLEHLRLTQWDIIDFCKNPNYVEPEWPRDYWPAETALATKKDWEKTIKAFQKDLKTLENLANDSKTNLYSQIPWGDGQTIFREILVVADHNAYHIGEFAIMRQVMRTWGER